MNTVLLSGKVPYLQSALGAMHPQWYLCVYTHIRDLLWAVRQKESQEKNIIDKCFKAAVALSREYIDQVIFKKRAKKPDVLCCRYDPEKKIITICLPLDASQERYFKVLIYHGETCEVIFSEPAHKAFAPMAYEMCWKHGAAESIIVVDGVRMKWKHLAFIAQGLCFNFFAPPLLDAISEEYRPFWEETNWTL
jgi:hypothetical protein